MIPIEQAGQEWTNGILIQVNTDNSTLQTLDELKSVIERYPGDCATCLKIEIKNTPPILVKLDDEYMTTPETLFFKEIEAITGEGSIETRCAPVKEKQRKKKPWMKNNGR